MKIGLAFLMISLLAACGTCEIVNEDFSACNKTALYELILNHQSDSHSLRAAVNAGWDVFNDNYQTWLPYIRKWELILDRLVSLESGGIQTAVRELRVEVVDLADEDEEFRKGAFHRISSGPTVGTLDALERATDIGPPSL